MLVMFLFSQNHSSGLNGLSWLSGLAGVAKSCYNWLHVVTKVTIKWLQLVTSGYKWPHVVISGYKWLQLATSGHTWL